MWLNYSQRAIFREIYKFLESEGFIRVDSPTRKDIESIARNVSESEYISGSFYAVYKASNHDISTVIDNRLVYLDNLERYTITFTFNEELKELRVRIDILPLELFRVESDDFLFEIDINIREFLYNEESQICSICLEQKELNIDPSSIAAQMVGSTLVSHYKKYKEDIAVRIKEFSKYVSDIKKRFTDEYNAKSLYSITRMLENDGYDIPTILKQGYCGYYDPINPFIADQTNVYHFTKTCFVGGFERLELIIDIPRTVEINNIDQTNYVPVYPYLSIIQHSYLNGDKVIWQLLYAACRKDNERDDILNHLFEPLLKHKYKEAPFIRFNNVEEAMKTLDECVTLYRDYKNATDEIVEVGS